MKLKKNLKQLPGCKKGQTLIETLVASFMLTMGVSAAVGLAIYALNSSTSITKEIIGTGLAREGIEAVKNMRDTNWLQDTLVKNGCYDYASNPVGQQTANCYKNWLGTNGNVPFYCLDPSSGNGSNCNGNISNPVPYILGFDSSSQYFWTMSKDKNNNKYFGLSFDPNNSGTTGFYSNNPSGPGLPCSNGVVGSNGFPISDYCRKITLTKYSTGNGNAKAPFDKDDTLSLVYVQSQVWWVDKKCPRSPDWPGPGKCSIELDTYLTNWKNY